MVEIKGFNKAYKNCVAIQREKEARRKEMKRRIDDLVGQGVDRKIASVMVKALTDAGIDM